MWYGCIFVDEYWFQIVVELVQCFCFEMWCDQCQYFVYVQDCVVLWYCEGCCVVCVCFGQIGFGLGEWIGGDVFCEIVIGEIFECQFVEFDVFCIGWIGLCQFMFEECEGLVEKCIVIFVDQVLYCFWGVDCEWFVRYGVVEICFWQQVFV